MVLQPNDQFVIRIIIILALLLLTAVLLCIAIVAGYLSMQGDDVKKNKPKRKFSKISLTKEVYNYYDGKPNKIYGKRRNKARKPRV